VDRGLKLHRSSRSSHVAGEPDQVWSVVADATPGRHWYVDALPFVARGAVDRALGGAGRRWPVPGRPLLRDGDTAGFWRVRSTRKHTLELVADVRSPGRVVLETTVEPDGRTGSRVRQHVTFEPDGLLGQLYMLADLPAREVVAELAHRELVSELRRSSSLPTA
jgi:Protein of unknown function (DUF2867)/Polyketide cyclase / dehydrase and lipid transport